MYGQSEMIPVLFPGRFRKAVLCELSLFGRGAALT